MIAGLSRTTRKLGSVLATLGLGMTGCSVDHADANPFGDDSATEGVTGWDEVEDDSGSGGDDTGGEDDGIAGKGSLRRLTVAQYENTVRDLLGEPLSFSAELGDVEPLPDDGEFKSVAAARDEFSQGDLRAWFEGTLATVQPVFDDPDRRLALVGCTPETSDDPCAREFIARFGRRAFRRALEADELERYVSVAITARSELGANAWTGLHYATATILQAPSMLYVASLGEEGDSGRIRYTSLEMATRLAFALTNRGPDEMLLDAGEAGDLLDPVNVRLHAERLLDDPMGRRSVVEDMFGEYFALWKLDGLGKNPDVYPKWNTGVAMAMREELRLVLDWAIYDQDMGLPELLTNRTTFVDPQLADLYGMPAPVGEGFTRFDVPDTWARVGLLGLGAYLAINGKTHRTAPTLRGRFITSRLLCTPVAPPPPDIPPLPEMPEDEGHQTMRQMLEEHATNDACKGCHQLMDPPGLALEHFDGVGAHRDTDQGLPLDVTGELNGVAFDGAVELAGVLAADPALRSCLAKQLFRYASGTEENHEPELAAALSGLGEQTDGNIRELLIAIVTDDSFRYFRNDD